LLYTNAKIRKENAMFFGQYNYQLDEKNRARVPSKLRLGLSNSYVITKGLNNSLFIYSKDYFESQFLDKLNTVPTFDIEAQRPIRALLSSSFEVEEDKQGRFVIPANLREFAGITKDVVFVGVGHRLELWSAENWAKYQSTDKAFDEVLGELVKYNV